LVFSLFGFRSHNEIPGPPSASGLNESPTPTEKWGRKVERRSMRWHRDGTQKWKNTKVVTMVSSIDIAIESVIVSRKMKANGKFEKKGDTAA